MQTKSTTEVISTIAPITFDEAGNTKYMKFEIDGIPVRWVWDKRTELVNIVVPTADGQPSELSVDGLTGDGAEQYVSELSDLIAASPRLAQTPRVDRAAVRQLQAAGVRNAFAAAASGRTIER